MLGLVDYSDDEESPTAETKEEKPIEQKVDMSALPPPKRRRTTKSISIAGLATLPSFLNPHNGSDSEDDDSKDDLFGESLFGKLTSPQQGVSKNTSGADDDEDPVAEAIRARTRERGHTDGGGPGFAALLPEPKHAVAPLPCPSPGEDEDNSLVNAQHADGTQVVYSTSVTDKSSHSSQTDKIVEVAALDVAAARTKEEELLEHAPAFIPTIAAPDTATMISGRSAHNKNQLGLMAARAHEVEQELALKRYNSRKTKAQSMAKYGW